MCSLVALVALANHMFSMHTLLTCFIGSRACFALSVLLLSVQSLLARFSDALLVAFDTLMRFVAWSDKLYSAFGTHVGNIYTVSALVVH